MKKINYLWKMFIIIGLQTLFFISIFKIDASKNMFQLFKTLSYYLVAIIHIILCLYLSE